MKRGFASRNQMFYFCYCYTKIFHSIQISLYHFLKWVSCTDSTDPFPSQSYQTALLRRNHGRAPFPNTSTQEVYVILRDKNLMAREKIKRAG